jgi:hypothetical protein
VSETFQTVIVTLVAAGAAWTIVRRVFGTFTPVRPAKCASCPSAQSAPPALDDQPKPLIVVRSR